MTGCEMELCPNWHGGHGCPCDVLDLEKPTPGEWVTEEVWMLEEGRRLASWREDLIADGVDPADLLIPTAPAPRPHLAPLAPALAAIESAMRDAAIALRGLDWESVTHACHRIVVAFPGFARNRVDLSVARSCPTCCPGAGPSYPAPLCIDGREYRRRSRRRR